MKIEWNTIDTNFKGEYCFTHARGVICPNGFGIFTTQPLRLTGSDVFYDMYLSKTFDGGKSWSSLVKSDTIVRRAIDDGIELGFCDATPFYHKKTGKIILMGNDASYKEDEPLPFPTPRHTVYAVYDEITGDFSPFSFVEMPVDERESYYNCGAGSAQICELENGDLLIPVFYCEKGAVSFHLESAVMRCSFDGREVRFMEIGAPLALQSGRGLYEPSIARFKGEYFLALRNDTNGYVAKSRDGLCFDSLKELVFEDGANLGNYNTQQHWIVGKEKLYLVYTRRGANNDHVFRHRAPLFIAEYDPQNLCVIRETERVAVPERGARLGNFGCYSFEDGKRAIVFASEWMQTTSPNPHDWRRCMQYGSDNSIFISHITLD
jgi:hypothetical protein